MAGFSTYYANKVIEHMFRGQAFTPPATVYVALFSADTGLEANAPTGELVGNGYSRKAVTLAEAASAATSNSVEILTDTATGDWLEAAYFAIVDHETNTNWGTNVNVMGWNQLTTAKTAESGDVLRFLVGELDITIA